MKHRKNSNLVQKLIILWSKFKLYMAADPGFPRGRAGTNSKMGGARGEHTYYLAEFQGNCMKMKKIGPRGHSKCYYVELLQC